MSAERLQHELDVLGLRGEVEALGSLAVLTLAPDQLIDAHTRAQAVMVATRHGFTHLALELSVDRDDRAALSRP